LDSIAALVDQSLVYRLPEAAPNGSPEPRFAMLETVREFGLERLTVSGEEMAARQGQAAWALALAGAAEAALAGPDQATWLDRLELEADNARAALTWTLGDGERLVGLELAVALWRFWFIRHRVSEGRTWLERALAANPDASPELRARALNGLGALSHAQAAGDQAEAAFAEARDLFRSIGDRRGEANACNNLGILAWSAGDPERAATLHEAALALFRTLDDRDGIATSLNALGNVAHQRGAYARAAALHEESLTLYRTLDDRHGTAVAAISLGMAAAELGESTRASALYEESRALCAELGFQEGHAAAVHNLGEVARAMGEPALAADQFNQSLDLYRELDHQRGVATALRSLGVLARETGDAERAAVLAGEALVARAALGDRDGIADGLDDLAYLSAAVDPQRAARLLGAADGVRAVAGLPVRASERAERDKVRATLRSRLGERTFTAAVAAGRALDPRQATAEALAPAGQKTPPTLPAGSSAHDLTRRELEVLTLLAQRRTDKEIAEALFISPRTVMAHVANIFSKLGVNARRDAAAYAVRQGLV
jgi:ATP/maltotriose-dependent transcriptional regulator MalT